MVLMTIFFNKDKDKKMINEDLVHKLEEIKQEYQKRTGTSNNSSDIKKPCGNSGCRVSIAIDDETPSFGSGKLDEFGFWENPCYVCARDYERRHPNEGPAWPYARKQGEQNKTIT